MHLHSTLAFIVSTLLGAVMSPAQAADAPAQGAGLEWKVGLAQTKITPEFPVFMAGYDNRNKPFEKVTSDLYVKAMVLEDREGRRAVLVSSDLIGFPADIAEPICDRIHAKTGLRREQILINSSHTHTGPELSLNAQARGAMTAEDAQRTVEYTRELADKVVAVVVKAGEHMEPVRLSWGSGVINFVMNRREFTPAGVILGVNPRGLADRTVPVLRVDGADGKPRVVLFGAAAHNVTLRAKNLYEICGDYAGFAQTYVQEKYPAAQAMFILGFAGDANTYPRGTVEMARAHGQSLGEEVCRVLETKLAPVRGPLTVAFDRISLPLQQPPPRTELEKLAGEKSERASKARRMLAVLDRGEKLPVEYVCPIAVWQFGEDLTLVGLSGEAVVDYVPLLEQALGPNRLWLSAYNNDVFGYLPSARVLAEGGYEALSSGRPGLFAPQAEEVVVKNVRDLAKKVGRHVPAATVAAPTTRSASTLPAIRQPSTHPATRP